MSKEATDSILRKLRALMAKTVENGCSEAEAKMAAEAVDRLMGEYDVQLDDLTVRSTKCDTRRIVTHSPRGPIRDTIMAIARFTDTKTWIVSNGKTEDFEFFGMEPDLDVAEYLLWLFKRSIDRETINFPMGNREYMKMDKQRRTEARISFGCGMAQRLAERLTELKSKRDWTTEHTTGTSLIVLKGQLVTEEYAKLGMKLGKTVGLKVLDGAAYAKGREAGDKVAINQSVKGQSQTAIK
jgi:hypothetical protein